LAVASFAVPIGLWWSIRRNGFALDPVVMIAGGMFFWALSLVLARAAWRKEPLAVWSGTAVLVASICVFGVSEVPKIATSNPRFRPYHELRRRPELAGVPFFRSADVHGKFIEVVWASGREIGFWDPRQHPAPPVEPPLVLMSPEAPSAELGPEIYEQYVVEDLGLFDADQGRWGGAALKNHVTLIRPRAR
jgi:hypothetical protein